jgi:hypothetical protein
MMRCMGLKEWLIPGDADGQRWQRQMIPTNPPFGTERKAVVAVAGGTSPATSNAQLAFWVSISTAIEAVADAIAVVLPDNALRFTYRMIDSIRLT